MPGRINGGASGTCMNGYIIGSYVFGFSGGALIGWPLGTAIAGGDPVWYLAGIGAGLIGVGVLFEILGKKQCGGYVYQQTAPTMQDYALARKAKVGFASSGNTVGLQLVF